MKNIISILQVIIILICIPIILTACDRSSSPEGRMTLKLEELQKQMMDSLKHQNKMIRDSLSAIRSELNEMKKQNN